MFDWDELLKKIGTTGGILTGIVGILGAIAAIYKFLKPLLAILVFVGTIVIPNGFLVWNWMYAATSNANRLGETQVFNWLIVQLTFFVSAYTFCWGKWFYPRLAPWLKNSYPKHNHHILRRKISENKKMPNCPT